MKVNKYENILKHSKTMKSQMMFFIMLLIMLFILTGCAPENQAVEATQDTSLDTAPTEVSGSSPVTYTDFFTENMIHEINIEISENNWAELLEKAEDETYYSANITLDGVTATNVGFRTKGNSSLKSVANSESDRFSFRIKLGKYVEDQEILGLDEFVLNNMFSDASYMREYLSYKIMAEAGLDVPLSSYVNVSVNGESVGFYLMVEAIDDSFLNRAFGDNAGNLYKQELGSTLLYETDQAYKNSEQKNGDDESKTDIASLIKVLNEMPEGEKGDIESVLDVDSALKYIAANTVLENYDSYNGTFAQNYYLYNNEGIFTVIPWDFNMSFGGFEGGILSTIDIDEPIHGTTLDKVPLISKLLAVEAYKTRYYEIIESYVAILEDFETEVTNLAKIIRPFVEADPTKFVTLEQFDLNVTYQEGGESEANPNGGMMGRDFNSEMPPGERPAGLPADRQADMPKGGMKGGMNFEGSSSSLINIMQARIENLKTQLLEK